MDGGGRVVGRLARDPSVRQHRVERAVVRRVLGFARPFRRVIAVFLAAIVLGAVLSVAPPLLFKEIIDQGVVAGDRRVVVTLSLVVAGIAVVNAGNSLLQRWCSARIGEGLIYDLRTQVFDHVMSMPLAFFSRTHTGKLISRVQGDVIGAQQAFTSTLSTVLSNLISLVLVLVAMISLDWKLTLAALVLLPVFLLPARIIGSRLAGLTRESLQLNADLSATMTERFGVSGALLVKLFGRPDDEHRVFADRAAAVRDIGVQIAMIGRFFMTAMTLVAALATALVYGVGGLSTINATMTIGTLTALAALLIQLYGPLMQLSNVRIDVMSALVSFERVFEVLDLEPLIAERPGAHDLDGPASIEFRHVDFTYPRAADVSLATLEPTLVTDEGVNAAVLSDVSFTAAPGETVALVGPSGAGKTTMTHLLTRLYDVSGGAVLIGGVDVREVTFASLQRSIGYVTQDAHMFHDTIRHNLAYARPDATEADMMAALEAARIKDLVERLPDGLDTMVGERGYRLSGGERQRFAIARLFIKAPPIVVLDEATAHLDSESETAVQQALDNAMQGRTSVVVAHRLSTVRRADQILVVDGGRIVERGRHADLLAAGGVYADLYTNQFGLPDSEITGLA